MATKRFNWMMLQEGTLALRPAGQVDDSLEHRPTSTLIWPVDEPATRDNTILVDPYFTANSFRAAEAVLSQMKLSFGDIGRVFVTHEHFDHLPHYPSDAQAAPIRQFEPTMILAAADVILPGHGAPIRVTGALLEHLIVSFPKAELAADCPDVEATLRGRLLALSQEPKRGSGELN